MENNECQFDFLDASWESFKNIEIECYIERQYQYKMLLARIIGGLNGNEDYFTKEQLTRIKNVFDNAIKNIKEISEG